MVAGAQERAVSVGWAGRGALKTASKQSEKVAARAWRGRSVATGMVVLCCVLCVVLCCVVLCCVVCCVLCVVMYFYKAREEKQQIHICNEKEQQTRNMILS